MQPLDLPHCAAYRGVIRRRFIRLSVMPDKPSIRLGQVRERIHTKHYRLRTEPSYVQWIRRFILFHDKRHPKELGAPEMGAFLKNLATDRKVAASTQTQALCAVLFLYQEVFGIQLPWLEPVAQAKKPGISRPTENG